MGEIIGPTSEPKGADGKEAAGKKGPSFPSISLPKVLEAVRRIGEKFASNPLTGTGPTRVPIYMSPGRSGFGALPRLFAYAVAVIAVGGAVVTTLELGSAMKHTPTLFFCSVILTSWLGGTWPGIFAGLLSAIAMDYYFIPPIYALGISLEEEPDMVAFVASALFVSWLSGEQKRATAAVAFGVVVALASGQQLTALEISSILAKTIGGGVLCGGGARNLT
jgi:hypothetical protein